MTTTTTTTTTTTMRRSGVTDRQEWKTDDTNASSVWIHARRRQLFKSLKLNVNSE